MLVRVCAPLMILSAAALTSVGSGAASSTVVTMDVLSATTFTDACKADAAIDLGTVLPGTPSTTTTGAQVCSFSFGSSNDTSMLRISQYDAFATAMTSDAPSWSDALQDSEPQRGLSIAPGSPATAMVVDGWGAARGTTNSGSTWNGLTSPGGGGCDAVAMVSTTVAFAGCGGAIKKTTNGGSTWNATGATGLTQETYALDAASTTAAIVGSWDGGVRYTIDGGTTWLTPATPPPAGSRITALDMVNASTGFMIRHADSTVYRTDDGGANWTALTMSGTAGTCYGLSAATTTAIWVGCDGNVQRSTNGTTFADTSNIAPTPMTHIAAVDANTAIAAGWRGEMYRTSDGGSTWTQVGYGLTSESITGIRRDGTRMYAIAAGGVILSSNDTGVTWTRQRVNTDGEFLNDVDQFDANDAWAVGDIGKIRYSSDGGQNWVNQSSGTTVSLRGVAALTATKLIAVGDSGTILRSTDGGTNWAPVTSGTSEHLREVAVDDGRFALAVGTSGIVLRSDDAGATWKTVRDSSSSPEQLNDVAWSNPTTAWIVGENETFERSTDGGRTWTPQAISVANSNEPFAEVDASGDGKSVVVGVWGYGEIYFTSDGGATWTDPAGSSSLNQVGGLVWHGNGTIHVTSVGTILSSSDWGATISTDDEFWHALGGIDAIDTSRGITVGEGGSIQRQVPPTPISDYGGGNTWGSAGTTSMFGVCLQQVGGSAVADWTVDAAGTANLCEATDVDPWNAVSTTPVTVAHTASTAQTGSVDLVFGVRPADDQTKGRYRAKVRIEVLAPWIP